MPKAIGSSWWSALLVTLRSWVRGLIIGRPLATSVQLEHRLPIYLALPVFASDAMSSVAYATQEILIAFEDAQAPALAVLTLIMPISIAIAILIVIVTTSYRQAIHLYPAGGGSYSVSRDTLGVLPSQIAASSLIVDYTLTVAVSVSSAVENLLASVPALRMEFHILGFPVTTAMLLAIALILLISLINLRGTRESGWTFAIPAYLFAAMLFSVIAVTIYRYATGNFTTYPTEAVVAHPTPLVGFLGIFIILRAFASGCTALTGVESVSNGVTAFEPPETKNAARTLFVLMIVLVVLFTGVGFAAQLYHALPLPGQTTISQVAQAAFGGRNIFYFLTTTATLLILMIAANTSFAGFPRLLALVARDGYAPKAFTGLGDRLVYTRGILALMAASILLVVVFRAETTALIPLYAVGVFICFTLAQVGMAKKVRDLQQPGWKRTAVYNLVGAFATGLVAIIQATTKFTQGAWMVVVLLPTFVLISTIIKRHYQWFDEKMTLHPYDYNPLKDPAEPLTVLVLVSSDVHRGIMEGLEVGRSIADGRPENILRAIHIELDPEKTARLKTRWAEFVEPHLGQSVRLDIIPSPFRWLVEPLMDYLDEAELERPNDRVIVVLPEFETGSTITHFLHNFTARRLRTALLNRPHITVVSARYFMRPIAWRRGRGGLVY